MYVNVVVTKRMKGNPDKGNSMRRHEEMSATACQGKVESMRHKVCKGEAAEHTMLAHSGIHDVSMIDWDQL